MIKFKNKLLFLLGSLFVVMGLQAENKSTSIVFSEQGYNNAQSITKCNIGDDITAEFSKGSNPKYGPTYYNTGTALRLYSGNTMTISGDDNVTINTVELVTQSEEYNVEKSSSVSIGKLTIKDTKATISYINSNSVTYTQGGSSGQVRIMSIKIIYSVDESIVVSPSKPETPVLTESCEFFEKQMVEITNTTVGATIYYTTDGNDPSADNGTKYESPFTITETTTVKAIAVKEGESSDIVEATYTRIVDYYRVSFSINGAIDADDDILIPYDDNLTENSLPTVEHPGNIKMKGWAREANSTDIVTFPITNIKEDLILYAVFEQVGCFELVTDVNALTEGDRVVIACPEFSKVISTADMIINGASCAVSTKVEFNDNALTPTEDTRVFVLHKNSDGSFMFEDGGKFLTCPEDDNRLSMQAPKQNMHLWTVTIADGTTTIQNKKFRRGIKYYSADPRFACYASGQKPVSIYKEIIPTTISTTYTPLQISAVGYSTMYLDKDVTIPTNVEAYLATEVGDGYIVMTQHRGLLPKETGIILKGDEGKYAFMHSEATAVVKSLLKGTLSNEYVSGGGYVLSVQDGVVGLYAAKLFDGKFLNNANKAYLPASVVPKELQSNGFRISVGSETCINRPSLEFDYLEGIYDLQGRKVLKMEKGIYILNGKKVLVK